MKKMILLAAMSVIPALAGAQIDMVKNGSAVSRIVLADNDSSSVRAANLLNKFVKRISGTTLPLSDGKMKKANDIVIGGRAEGVGEDGFVLECSRKQLRIASGGGSGSINGVVRLLEKYMGCDYFSYKEWSCPTSENIRIPAMKVSDEPAFGFRQTQCYALQDPDYVDWFAMENQSQIFADNLWVHTFNRLLPSDKYGKAHPEYYALINGERRPGTHSQWCLTNPDVFEVVCHNVDSIFKANPGMKMISVSQNDGNDTYCHCPKCKAIDDYEGSPSGNIIRFLNKLAARFPDKQFSTLAYLFSMQPPRHTKPLPNVNIMLCDIDCKREVPLTDNASGCNFMKALTGWSAITDNIFIWDYVINFDNYIAPFPNFHILQKNIQTFKKNHARMLFEQAGSPKGTDLCELRQYMITKLMWNPYQDADSLMQHFLNGYYGKAAPELYQYIKIMQGGLVASRVPLWIYDSPVSHKDGMLNANMMKMYAELFDKAEKKLSGDTVRLRRLHIARLPLQYSELEMMRTSADANPEQQLALLDTFESRCKKYGVTSLNENNNRVPNYCRLYRERFIARPDDVNLARGAKVKFVLPPDKKYMPIADKAITDGLYGGASYVESWVGWNGRDGEYIVDLGSVKQFNTITTDFLFQNGAWILLPKSVTYQVSEDGKKYEEFGRFDFEEDRSRTIRFVPATVATGKPVSARYVKVHVNSIGLCPSWHYGVGYPAWFFLDETSCYMRHL